MSIKLITLQFATNFSYTFFLICLFNDNRYAIRDRTLWNHINTLFMHSKNKLIWRYSIFTNIPTNHFSILLQNFQWKYLPMQYNVLLRKMSRRYDSAFQTNFANAIGLRSEIKDKCICAGVCHCPRFGIGIDDSQLFAKLLIS